MTVTITQADLFNSTHAENILLLLNHYAEDEMGGGQAISSFVKANLIQRLKQRTDTIILLAWEGTIPVGLLIAFEGFSTFYAKPLINIHDLVVLKNYRGKGISIQILTAIEKIGKDRGCCKLTLEVLEGNKRAQKVYRSFGFNGYELDEKMGKALFWEKKL